MYELFHPFKETVSELYTRIVTLSCILISRHDQVLSFISIYINLITRHKSKTELYTIHFSISHHEKFYWLASCETANRMYTWCCILDSRM